jgi:hydroxymethylglutaryl-CoA synthase
MAPSIGIDALAIAVPRRYVELEDLARARGVDPEKFTVGLGCRRMAVADPGEDSVALAASAARRLIETTGLDPRRIGMLVVGTETGVDHAKPVASHVQGLLELPRGMRVYDTQHACYGGTAALMASAEWIASGAAAGKVAIVICTDIARYGLNTPGEPTQGGGAIAMLVAAEPRLLALDLGVTGSSSADVYDFWRPHGRREAVVDGHYSIGCYLDALAGAYRAWHETAVRRGVLGPRNGTLPSAELERIIYHIPFPKMARKAHAHVRRCDIEDARGARLTPAEEAAEAPLAAESFERQVAASLRVPAEIGNVYTGSLYFGLAGLLETDAAALSGRRIGLFSYGSGCCGEFFSGTVATGAERRIVIAGIGEVLGARERIDIAEYTRIMELAADAPLAEEPAPGTFRFVGVRDQRRIYAAGAAAAQAAAGHGALAPAGAMR